MPNNARDEAAQETVLRDTKALAKTGETYLDRVLQQVIRPAKPEEVLTAGKEIIGSLGNIADVTENALRGTAIPVSEERKDQQLKK